MGSMQTATIDCPERGPVQGSQEIESMKNGTAGFAGGFERKDMCHPLFSTEIKPFLSFDVKFCDDSLTPHEASNDTCIGGLASARDGDHFAELLRSLPCIQRCSQLLFVEPEDAPSQPFRIP